MKHIPHFVVCTVLSFFLFQVIYSQTAPNTITFENESGELGLVKVIGPTSIIQEVPNGLSRTVNVSTGEYFILVRYGNNVNNYKYTKGEKFKVSQTTNEFSATTITLHKVADGNYSTTPVSGDVFDSYSVEEESANNASIASNISTDSLKSDKSNWLLYADQDNESLLKTIGKYIETFYNVSPKYIFNDDDKLVLTYDLSLGESPVIRINVETLSSREINEEENKKAIERRIKISAFVSVTEVIDDMAIRDSIMELNNKMLNKLWVPHSISITSNGRIGMYSSINIPGKDFPLHAEYVRELISGTLAAWEEYSKKLLRILNQSKK
jgi:hypothetical protein